MAMVKCHECGSEISTEAKACPRCGAKNKHRKVPRSLKWLLAIALSVVGMWFYGNLKEALDPNFCGTSIGRKEFTRVFENSPFAQRQKLRVVDVMSQKEVSRGEQLEDTKCEFQFRVNDGRELAYTLSFLKSETAAGGYLIHIKPK